MPISSCPKGTVITPAFRTRLERALRGRTHVDLMRLVQRQHQAQHVGRALDGFPLTRPSHQQLEEAVQAAEKLAGGGGVGTPAVVASPARARPALREVTSRSVLIAAMEEQGVAGVLRIAAEVLGKAS